MNDCKTNPCKNSRKVIGKFSIQNPVIQTWNIELGFQWQFQIRAYKLELTGGYSFR